MNLLFFFIKFQVDLFNSLLNILNNTFIGTSLAALVVLYFYKYQKRVDSEFEENKLLRQAVSKIYRNLSNIISLLEEGDEYGRAKKESAEILNSLYENSYLFLKNKNIVNHIKTIGMNVKNKDLENLKEKKKSLSEIRNFLENKKHI